MTISKLAWLAGACLVVALTGGIGAQEGGGGGQGGPGGGGGGEVEGPGNNLAVPAIFAEGYGVTGLDVTVDPGVRPLLTGETCTDSDSDSNVLTCFDDANVTIIDGVSYYPQQTSSFWRPDVLDGRSAEQHALVNWGDNLLNQRWTSASIIRVETSMYQVLPEGTTMNGLNMVYLSGEGTTEMWGTDGSVVTFPREVTEIGEDGAPVTVLVQPGVYSVSPRLKIEKISAPGGAVLSTSFDGSVAEGLGADGPGFYGAEINVSGKVVYGYNWMLKNEDGTDAEKAGWYRITFSLDPTADYTITAEDGTSTSNSVARNVIIDGPDAGDAADTVIFRPRVTDSYTSVLEIEVLEARTGGQPLMPLSVVLTGSGSGHVTSDPAGIDCGTDCTENYAKDTVVTLTATAEKGSVFAGWDGDDDCLDGSLTMTGGRYCEAAFSKKSETAAAAGATDVNGDGTGDLMVYDAATGDYTVEFLDGTSTGGKIKGSFPTNSVVRAGDFDGNGMTDFFAYASDTGNWKTALYNGSGGFQTTTGKWSPGWDVHVLDLNGDSLSDVFLYSSASGAWARGVSTAAGSFLIQSSGNWSAGWQVYPASLNGDQFDDLFLYNSSSGVWFRAFNDGGSNFSYVSGVWSAGWEIDPADFNGDGRTDLFLYSPTSGVWFVANTGAGNYFDYTSGAWSSGWQIHPADFDGNQRSDLMLYNPTSGVWFQVVSRPGGYFDYHSGVWSPDWEIQAIESNNDGRSDVFLYNSTTGTWFVAVSQGLGSFSFGSGTWAPGLTVVGQMQLP